MMDEAFRKMARQIVYFREKFGGTGEYPFIDQCDREVREQFGFGKYGIPRSNEDRNPYRRSAFARWVLAQINARQKQLHALVKRLAPELKTLVAAAYEPRLDGVVDIFLSYSSPDVMQAARRKGIEFWWWGNAAFDVSMCAIDQRLRFGFESFQKGYSGSYAWGLGLWTQSNNRRRKPEPYDVWTQPQRANKSCTVLYPGGVWQSKDVRVAPSLSLEITRDGIEDYEYIGLLQARHAALKNRSSDTAKAIEALLERARTFYVAPPPQRSDFDAVDALSKLRRDIAAALTQ